MDEIKQLFIKYGYLKYWNRAKTAQSSYYLDLCWRTMFFIEEKETLRPFMSELLFNFDFRRSEVYEKYFETHQDQYEDDFVLISMGLLSMYWNYFQDFRVSADELKNNISVYEGLIYSKTIIDFERFDTPEILAKHLNWNSYLLNKIDEDIFLMSNRGIKVFKDFENYLFMNSSDNDLYKPLNSEDFFILSTFGLVFNENIYIKVFEESASSISNSLVQNFIIDLFNIPNDLDEDSIILKIEELLEDWYIGFDNGFDLIEHTTTGLIKLHGFLTSNESMKVLLADKVRSDDF